MNVSASHPADSSVPLVVDVDGTLLKTDLLAESFRALLLHKPVCAFLALLLLKDKAAFKKRIAKNITLRMEMLPVNPDVVALVKQAKEQGRKVYLASASDRILVEALARYMGLFDGVFASDGSTNLRGEAKARALVDAFGERGFDYAGDSAHDFPIWQKAREVIAVGNIAHKASGHFPHVRILGVQTGFKEYARAMRVHQWAKNLLIFVPTLMAHKITAAALLPAVVAYFSFSLCASSVYLLNDWFDLDNDRLHPEKQHRMLASGALSLLYGMELILILSAISLVLAVFLPKAFLMTLAAYFALNFAYSLWLKHKVLIDVIILACLYGVRLVSGAALGVPLSEWLVAFSVFLFLSLAMVKRCAELINCATDGRSKPVGRGYLPSDITAIFSMATASGYVAVLVLAFYIHSPEVSMLYMHPTRLWGACLIMTYWISRVLLLTSRGEMQEDPVTFAISDRASLFCAVLLGVLLWVSV